MMPVGSRRSLAGEIEVFWNYERHETREKGRIRNSLRSFRAFRVFRSCSAQATLRLDTRRHNARPKFPPLSISPDRLSFSSRLLLFSAPAIAIGKPDPDPDGLDARSISHLPIWRVNVASAQIDRLHQPDVVIALVVHRIRDLAGLERGDQGRGTKPSSLPIPSDEM